MGRKSHLSQVLSETHNTIINNFQNSINNDSLIAADLEKFFNALLYHQNFDTNNLLYFKTVMNENVLEEIRLKNPKIFGTKKSGASWKWKEAEDRFGYIISALIDSAIGNDVSKLSGQSFSTGTKQATVALDLSKYPEKIRDQILKGIKDEGAKLVNDSNGMYHFAFRSQKSDIDMGSLSIEGQVTPEVQSLLDITASVKNYSDFEVHLENVNKQKAYLAIISYIKGIDENQADVLFQRYYIKQTATTLTDVNEHLTHLANLYGLTGIGQISKIDYMSNKLIQQFSKYLIINNKSAERVRVISTKQAVLESLDSGNYFATSNTRFTGHTSHTRSNIYKASLRAD